MTPTLTDDQRQAIEEHDGAPIYLVDASTNASYVLMRAEQFERVKSILDEEFDPRETYPFVDRVMQEDDENDPTLASYQSLSKVNLMIKRGDVVIVSFPFASGGGGKNRPALVIQADRNNQRLQNTIVAMMTGNIRLATTEPTQLLIDPATPEGRASGLANVSAIKCENLYTIAQQDIIQVVGTLPQSIMSQVDASLKASLGLL